MLRLCVATTSPTRRASVYLRCVMSQSSPTATRLTGAGSAAPTTVRVTTYNVLSSHLGGADYFTHCDPAALHAPTRLARVLTKLKAEVVSEAVICLQEVSLTWAGSLHAFFAASGYTFVLHCYGSPFNNYMGSGLAWKTSRFTPEAVEIVRVSDGLGRSKAPRLGGFAALRARASALVSSLLRRTAPPTDEWAFARSRSNALVLARLRDARTSGVFAAGTYHMPCAFKLPRAMAIHAALAAQKALSFAGPDVPLVLAGDWNVKPGDAVHSLLITGDIAKDSAAYPTPPGPWERFSPALPAPLRSAYEVVHGREPEFTNFAQTKDDAEPFCDTLDYIFVTSHWQCLTADELPAKGALPGPLPSAAEPSDHLMLSAVMRF